jgi:predicted aldo/keto reductase-like oxidoreductase
MGAGTAAPWDYTNNGCGPTAEGRNLTEKRPFGETGVELPILSLGCQQLLDEEGCSQDQVVAILEQALIEARDEGLVRFISISGHPNSQLLLEAIRRFPFDTALCAVSALDHFIYSFAEEFLLFALQKCMGVVGMKVLSCKAPAADWQRALR